jgi:phosphoglycolate phosphatase-like HAD superfamily hydrolase
VDLNIAFDLDGTLIGCENKQKYVLYSILNSLDSVNSITQEKLNYWWGLKRNGYTTELALTEMRFSDAKLVANKWIESIENYSWSYLDKPFKDSLSTFEYLKENYKINIIILTARTNTYLARQSINYFGFTKYISELVVVNPGKVIMEKERHLKIIKPLIYVGDSETDYAAATNSNIKFVGLTRGQRSKDFLKKLGDIQIEEDLKFLRDDDFVTNLQKDIRCYSTKSQLKWFN